MTMEDSVWWKWLGWGGWRSDGEENLGNLTRKPHTPRQLSAFASLSKGLGLWTTCDSAAMHIRAIIQRAPHMSPRINWFQANFPQLRDLIEFLIQFSKFHSPSSRTFVVTTYRRWTFHSIKSNCNDGVSPNCFFLNRKNVNFLEIILGKNGTYSLSWFHF